MNDVGSLWRVDEAAEYLGIRPKTLYEWVRTGRVPYRKLGFNVRFDPEELRAWVEAQSKGETTAADDEEPDVDLDGVAELRAAACEAADMLRRIETDLGPNLTFPRRQALQELVERLRQAVDGVSATD